MKFWCQCNQYNLWDNRKNHQSKHLFDQYSFVHISAGLLQYILFKKYGFLFNLIFHIMFEIFENAIIGVKFFQEEYKMYEGDTIANIISDLFMFAIGYFIMSKVKVNNILFFIMFDTLVYLIYKDSFLFMSIKNLKIFLYSKKYNEIQKLY